MLLSSPRWDYLKIASIIMVTHAPYVSFVALTRSDTPLDAYERYFVRMGFSFFDIVSTTLIVSIALVSNVAGFCLMARRRRELTELFGSYNSVCSDLDQMLEEDLEHEGQLCPVQVANLSFLRELSYIILIS